MTKINSENYGLLIERIMDRLMDDLAKVNEDLLAQGSNKQHIIDREQTMMNLMAAPEESLLKLAKTLGIEVPEV